MNNLIHEKQVGPIALPNLVDLFRKIVNIFDNHELELIKNGNFDFKKSGKIQKLINPTFDTLKEKVVNYKNKFQAYQRRIIVKAFEKNAKISDCFDPYFNVELGNDMYVSKNKKGEILPIDIKYNEREIYACYLNQIKYKNKYGIYFNVKNCLKDIINNQKIPIEDFIEIIAIHEIFHHFVYLLIGDKVGAHHNFHKNKDPYCYLEEAAANFVAFQEFTKRGSNNLIGQKLFKEYTNGGFHGYGEYYKLGEDIIFKIADIIRKKKCNEVNIFYSGFKIDYTAQNTWKQLLQNFNKENIPYYFDLYN